MAVQIWAVDDEESLLLAVGELLSDSGFEYRGFRDPRDVLPAIEEGPPDLLLVDLNMPRITGAELIKSLRSSEMGKDVPIIVLTALSSESALLNAFKAGADDVVRKPFSFSEMLARIHWQLERAAEFTALRRQNEDMRMLTELAQTMSREETLSNVLRVLIDSLKRTLAVSRCSVYLLDDESGELHRALPSDPSQAEGSPRMTLDFRSSERISSALAARKPVYLDAAETASLMETMGGAPVKATSPDGCSAALYPMQLQGRFVGLLVLISDRPNFGKSSRENSLCGIAADLTAVSARRSELFHSLRRDHFVIDERNRQLAEARDFLSGVIESSPDAIVVASVHGEIEIFNRAAEEVLGWNRDEAIGMNVRNLYPPGGAEQVMSLLRTGKYGGEGRLVGQRQVLVDREGTQLPVDISASIILNAQGEEIATIGIFKDVRRDLKMEEQLLAATEDLERTRRQVVVAELAGAAAHELNQPLTSLLGYAELLRRKLEDDEQLRVLSKVDADARRVADIVGKIGRITEYRTKEYVGGARIMDLDRSSEALDDDDSEVEN